MHDVVPLDERGYQSRLVSPFTGGRGLALATRLCRDGDRSLAALFRRIPADYLAVVCVRETRREAWVVRCVCGSVAPIGPDLTECPGGCLRWLIADESGAWAARLPEQEAGDE